MSEFYDDKNESSPTYKLHRKDAMLWIGIAAVVVALSFFFIWQMKNNAMTRINNQIEAQKAGVDKASERYKKLESYEEAAKTDPIGFDLSNFVNKNYQTVVTINYFVLAALTLAAVARFIAFLLRTVKPRKYYPADKEFEEFLQDDLGTWSQFYKKVSNMRHYGCAFWKVLKQSATVVNESKKYDHLYLHMRNRFDNVMENINEVALYESIATVSPAAGFFGTLIGLLFIFTQSENGIQSLTNSPAFAVGLKVAIITSLWGLLNLGAAIMFSYLTRKITEGIFDRMILKSFAICDVVERYGEGANHTAAPEVPYAKGHVNVK